MQKESENAESWRMRLNVVDCQSEMFRASQQSWTNTFSQLLCFNLLFFFLMGFFNHLNGKKILQIYFTRKICFASLRMWKNLYILLDIFKLLSKRTKATYEVTQEKRTFFSLFHLCVSCLVCMI